MTGEGSVAIEGTRLVIGNLMFPQSGRETFARLGGQFKTMVPEQPWTKEFVRALFLLWRYRANFAGLVKPPQSS